MTDRLHNAIELLQSATQNLTDLTAIPAADRPMRETINNTVEQIHRAVAELAAALDPPSLDRLPPESIAKAERLGIPLDDIEVRVAITTHHLSQFLGILAEIEQRFGEIRRVREYLLVRLPDMPIERLGSRLPVYTAADFEWNEPRLSPAELAIIRAKYQIDRRLTQPITQQSNDLFEQIATANTAWERAKVERFPDRSALPTPIDLAEDAGDLPF
jgi:hypothetical protein